MSKQGSAVGRSDPGSLLTGSVGQHVVFAADDATGLVRTWFLGPITRADLEAYARTLADRGLFARPRLVDARQAKFETSSEDITHFADIMEDLRRQHGIARTAFVAAADLQYAMGRMYSMVSAARDPGFAVFRSVEEAEAWLRPPESI